MSAELGDLIEWRETVHVALCQCGWITGEACGWVPLEETVPIEFVPEYFRAHATPLTRRLLLARSCAERFTRPETPAIAWISERS